MKINGTKKLNRNNDNRNQEGTDTIIIVWSGRALSSLDKGCEHGVLLICFDDIGVVYNCCVVKKHYDN